jgi:peptide/nickel transport system permease protein
VRYLLYRILLLLLTAWVALTFNFILPHMMPGNPAEVMVAKFQGRLEPQAIKALSLAFGVGVNESIFQQYLKYWGRILRGDFGTSLAYYPTPVRQVLGQAIPWTLGLCGATTILAFIFGSGLGIVSAWRRGSRLGDGLVPLALFLQSMPYFWFALLTLYTFSFVLRWFPLSGGYAFASRAGSARVLSILYHSFLPGITMLITASGGWVMTMRNNMISILAEDYITFAHAKGLSTREIIYHYAARNAVLPSFTGFAMALGFVVGGAILTEMVFSYPGVGYTLLQAVISLDYPLMQACFLFITLAVLLANFLADLTYVLLDPRVRSERAGS